LIGESHAGRGSDRGRRSELFCGESLHLVVAGAGHNVPQEQPIAFANAVLTPAWKSLG
jgi:pimeloyl-ACP methyl ester carboxylesterase